ncbi:MAG: class I SAM-dependent methyltransferase [Bdellovibrionales bacterium]
MASSEYSLLDTGGFRKLEQVGSFRLIRPAATAVWDPHLSEREWKDVAAEFIRHRDGTGEWRIKDERVKNPFEISIHGVHFLIKLTSFGHLGLFPEQEKNWLRFRELVKGLQSNDGPTRVLNLFAYTGGSTLFCAQAGAEVAHVDASKGTVKWASENAELSGLGDRSIRWLVDDVKEFVSREVRRGSKYDGIILDPPSYGKGEKRQVWKIESDLMPLLQELKKLFSGRKGSFFCLSAHSEAYTPTSLNNQLVRVLGSAGETHAEEMLIFDRSGLPLPSGASALWVQS